MKRDTLKSIAAGLLLLCVPFAAVAFDSSALPGPAGSPAFTATGGTVTQPVVLTGNNASGTGTLRIRPADEDTQLVLCEAGNNASPEVCSVQQHVNFSTTVSYDVQSTNSYVDSGGGFNRYNTSFGAARQYTQASSTQASNTWLADVFSTNGTQSGNVALAVTGAGTATFSTGTAGTVTNDFRGPITNGGSATCNGYNAGAVCIPDSVAVSSNTASIVVHSTTNTAGYASVQLQESSGGLTVGNLAYYGSTYSDSDYADKVANVAVSKILGTIRTDDVAATAVFREDRDNGSGTGVQLGGVYGDGADFKTPVTPTALSGDVDNYAGCTLSWCRISGGAANRNINGIASGADGKILNVCNIGTTNTLVLVDEAGTSTAANRFALDANITIPVERCQRIVYDNTSSRWRAQQ